MSAVRDLDVTLEIVADIAADIGEGPVWDQTTATLTFVDSSIGRIYRLDPANGALAHIDAGQAIGTAIPRLGGGLVASARDGLLAVDDDGDVDLLVPIEPNLANRMNDAKCDSRGRLWSGTFSLAFERGAGSLYRIDPDLTVTKALDGVFISNGLGWSPDERTFYYVDTGTRTVDAFDYDIATGAIAGRRRLIAFDRPMGLPDGLTVDAEGCLWVACYLGGAVRRFSPAGECIGAITVPVARVTSCTFGGAGLDELYVTTANQAIHDDGRPHEPHAGATYRCRPGTTGLPSHRFAG